MTDSNTHSEQDSETIRVALRLLAASNPMDEFPQEANAALTRLVEQVEALQRENAAHDYWKGKYEERGDELADLKEQFDAVERVANAAKMYRDVRSDYSWVQMIQALDAWEHPPVTNPASTSEAREEGDDA
jgi:hypothetical protein